MGSRDVIYNICCGNAPCCARLQGLQPLKKNGPLSSPVPKRTTNFGLSREPTTWPSSLTSRSRRGRGLRTSPDSLFSGPNKVQFSSVTGSLPALSLGRRIHGALSLCRGSNRFIYGRRNTCARGPCATLHLFSPSPESATRPSFSRVVKKTLRDTQLSSEQSGRSPTSWLCQEMPSQDFSPDFPATRRVRANHRRHLVAVNTHPASDPSTLLQVATACEVKVKCKQLINNKCVGMVFGVDQRIDAKDYAANITSPDPATSCVRRGKCLTMECFSAGYPGAWGRMGLRTQAECLIMARTQTQAARRSHALTAP